MENICTTAAAKVNLSLDILGKRADGYHNLSTIMHSIPLSDDIFIEFKGESIICGTNLSYIRSEKNIAVKAALTFFKASGIPPVGMHIHIHKRIPVGAGLGGGSADAAAVLSALNATYGAPLDMDKLVAAGRTLGADVPFMLYGGCALCEGIGDKITPIKMLPTCSIVVIKPRVSLSTAEMFSLVDSAKSKEHPDTDGLISALNFGAFSEIARRVFNVMESAAAIRCSEIPSIRLELQRLGAAGACMSGSGSAVFGIFESSGNAKRAAELMRSQTAETFFLQIN